MDLLVTLCASYHLNPTDFTVEVLSPNKDNISFKPNSPIGLLEANKIVLKPKGVEEKIRRPYMPEVTKKVASLKLQQQERKKEKDVYVFEGGCHPIVALFPAGICASADQLQ